MSLKNIKLFLKKHTLLFIMLVLTQVIAICAILFSYGIYSDSKYNEKSLNNKLYCLDIVSSGNENADALKITKEIFPDILLDLEDDLRRVEIWTRGTFDKAISVEDIGNEGMAIDFDYDGYKYKTNVVSMFTIENGEYKYDSITKKLMGKITDGKWYSEEAANRGELVCVVSGEFADVFDSEVSINGVVYQIEAKAHPGEGFNDQIAVPLQAMSDEMELKAIFITFYKPLVKSKYDDLVEKLEDALGEKVIINDYCSASLDEAETYRTMMLIAVIMALIASFVVCLIYRNILERRIHATGVYLICGSTRLTAALVYIKEMTVILAATTIAGIIIYLKCIMPRIAVYFTYFDDIYSKSITYKLPVMYFLIVFVFSTLMIGVKMRKTPMQIMTDLKK